MIISTILQLLPPTLKMSSSKLLVLFSFLDNPPDPLCHIHKFMDMGPCIEHGMPTSGRKLREECFSLPSNY